MVAGSLAAAPTASIDGYSGFPAAALGSNLVGFLAIVTAGASGYVAFYSTRAAPPTCCVRK
jgi:hypothetical protein